MIHSAGWSGIARNSVAAAIARFLLLNYDAKEIMRIFSEIEHIENQGVTFLPERIRPVFSTLLTNFRSVC